MGKLTAHPVREITPLFAAWLTIGIPVPKALIRLPMPSHRIPPWIRLLNSIPSMSKPEISAVAKISGIQLTASQMKRMRSGRASAPSTDSLKVSTQRKVATGAASILSRDQYPVAPDIAHPTASPKTTDAERMRGDPKSSTTMIVTNTLNPRPMSFGFPLIAMVSADFEGTGFHLFTYQGSGFGASVSGQRA